MSLSDRDARRAYHREYMRRRYHTDPEHRRKQIIRNQTWKRKDKPVRCPRCGGPRPEGHHPDYRQPRLIEWLCRSCHLAEHRKEVARAS